MSIKRGIGEHRDLLLVLILAVVALSSFYYSQSTNETPSTEYVFVEYLDELSAEQSNLITGGAVTEMPPADIYKLMDNEPPSAYRSRMKYGCYKRCACSYADTCQCFYGGCFKVNEDEPEIKGIPVQGYESVGTKRLNYMVRGTTHHRYYGPDK